MFVEFLRRARISGIRCARIYGTDNPRIQQLYNSLTGARKEKD
jgi:hypothetical protein